MGTRADFYVGRGESAEWLGSIAWDGYPDGLTWPQGKTPLTEKRWRGWVARMLAKRDDSTTPDVGWPWPWPDSRTTDYAYAYDDGAIWVSCFGHEWAKLTEYDPDADTGPEKMVFPNMVGQQKVTFGPRSGILIFKAKENK